MSATTGNDLLIGTAGDDFIDLLAGDDSYSGLDGNDSILGNTGNDTLSGGNGADSILGGDGADTIYGDAGDDSISGGNGDDRLFGGLGNDTIDAGAGNSDRIRYDDLDSLSPVTVVIENSGSSSGFNRATVSTAAQGTDSIMGFEILTTTTGNDHITVNSVATATALLSVFANRGNDTIIFNTTDISVLADYQHGQTEGGVTVDLLAGTAVDPFGTDSLVGARNINGSDQNDIFLGSDFNDRFRGRGGNDYFDGRGGSDIADYAYLGAASQGISVNLAAERAFDGSNGTDTLISIEQVRGGAGNDTIIGDGKDNIFRGNNGNDTMDGGGGTFDVVDYAFASSAISVNLNDSIASDGANGTDRLVNIEVVWGSGFNDTLIGGVGNDVLRGNAGNDFLDGGAGSADIADYRNATTGITVNLATGAVQDGQGGIDTLNSIEQIWGGTFNDSMLGGDGNDFFVESSGADTFAGGGGIDTVSYSFNPFNNTAATQGVSIDLAAGTGRDGYDSAEILQSIEVIIGTSFADTISGGTANETIFGNGGAGNDMLSGGAGHDQLTGGNGADTLDGGEGADTLYGIGGADSYSGGEGADQLVAGNGADTMDGGNGNDTLSGGNDADSILGGEGADQLIGGSGNDLLYGGNFSDQLIGGSGNDLLDGGIGLDVAAYDSNASSQAVSVNLLDGRAADGLGGTDTLSGIEYVWGSEGNDTIIGGNGADSLWGNSGNDTLVGGIGADTLDGGSGNDTITGGDGSDRIFGGTGSDSIDAGAGTGDIISFNHTSAQAVSATISAIGGSAGSNYAVVNSASQGNDTIINFENIDGSFENDGFTINSAATDSALLFVLGSIGADTIAVNIASAAVMADYGPAAGSLNVTRGVIVDLTAGTADDGRGGIDSLVGVRGVNGSSFGDTILGSAFNDRFREQGGSDSINGRDGFDMLDYSGNSASQSVSVNLAAERASDGRGGTDTVISMEYARSGSGNDTLIGNAADNELRGGSGADILDGGASGVDIADYANNTSAQAISVNLTTGRASDGFGFNDTLVSIEYIRGGSGNDTMIGSAANERFRGNAGNDTIDGGNGTEDILDLSQTTQSVSANLVTGLANDGLDGTDRFTGIEVVYSGTASDTLLGSDRNEIFDGGMGGDLIDGGLGADRVRYWNVSGRNSAITQGVSVDLAAQRATDGWGGQDTLIGIELVTATDFADTLLGDNVGNRFNGRAGNDSIDGGLSIDWLEYLDGDATAGVTVNLTTGTASDGRGGTDIFTSIENVSGQGFADHLTGIAQLGRSTSRLRGGGGSDTLVGIVNEFVTADYTDQTMGLSVNLASGSVNDGLGGIDQLVNIRGAIMLGSFADTIIGTAGNDWLSPGGGNDTISGGDGLDIISYDGNPTSGVSVNLAAGRASDGDGGTDSLNGVEGVWVSYSNDTVIGDGQGNLIGLGAGADSADAAAGQDTISYSLGFSPNISVYVFNEAQNQLSFTGVIIDLAAGRATDYGGAADTILNFEAAIGSTMHDSILGSNGNDVLDGAEGNDTLNGFGGDDRMFGGQGNDMLIAGLGTVNLDGGAGDDVILVGNVTLTEIHALFGP